MLRFSGMPLGSPTSGAANVQHADPAPQTAPDREKHRTPSKGYGEPATFFGFPFGERPIFSLRPRRTQTRPAKAMSRTHNFTPRAMQAQAAAYYLGVSVTKFRSLELPSKASDGNVLYDVHVLDAWFDGLPEKGTQECQTLSEADRAFGIAAE